MPEGRLYIGNRRYSSWSMRGWLAVRLAGLDVEEGMIHFTCPGPKQSFDHGISLVMHQAQGPVIARFAGLGFRVPAPLLLTGYRIDGREEARNVSHIAGDSDDDLVLYHQRRNGEDIRGSGISRLYIPHQVTGLGI